MIILGIETSCDETALALIETRGGPSSKNGESSPPAKDLECRVISSLVHSQAELHSAYGGVFPTLAKREHGRNLVPLLEKLLRESGCSEMHVHEKPADSPRTDTAGQSGLPQEILQFKNELESQNPDLWESLLHARFWKGPKPPIDAIAVTEGPGLEPALWVGINFARVLATLWHIPLIPVNHMEGHVVGSLLPSDKASGAWQKLHELPLPSIALLISGGHTELVKIAERPGAGSWEPGEAQGAFAYEIIGETKDDAVGEAFDKAARLLGLPYPGGPHLARLSHEAWEEKIPSPVKLPRPMIASKDLDFSFSGLKTAVLYAVRDAAKDPSGALDETFKKGVAYEFEQAVADTLEAKLRLAVDKTDARSIIVGGGVSANHVLRQRFEKVATEYGIPLFLPSAHISGDNALMIALVGALHHAHNDRARTDVRAHGTKRLK